MHVVKRADLFACSSCSSWSLRRCCAGWRNCCAPGATEPLQWADLLLARNVCDSQVPALLTHSPLHHCTRRHWSSSWRRPLSTLGMLNRFCRLPSPCRMGGMWETSWLWHTFDTGRVGAMARACSELTWAVTWWLSSLHRRPTLPLRLVQWRHGVYITSWVWTCCTGMTSAGLYFEVATSLRLLEQCHM